MTKGTTAKNLASPSRAVLHRAVFVQTTTLALDECRFSQVENGHEPIQPIFSPTRTSNMPFLFVTLCHTVVTRLRIVDTFTLRRMIHGTYTQWKAPSTTTSGLGQT